MKKKISSALLALTLTFAVTPPVYAISDAPGDGQAPAGETTQTTSSTEESSQSTDNAASDASASNDSSDDSTPDQSISTVDEQSSTGNPTEEEKNDSDTEETLSDNSSEGSSDAADTESSASTDTGTENGDPKADNVTAENADSPDDTDATTDSDDTSKQTAQTNDSTESDTDSSNTTDAAIETPSPASSTAATTTPEVRPTYHLTIRHQDTVIFDDELTIPDELTLTYHESGTTTSATTTIATNTAFALINAADTAVDRFTVSDLAYYASFDSYLLNCLSIATIGEACNNWQYVVDGTYPSVGMDKYTISEGDHVYLYFGERYRVAPTANTFYTGSDTLSAVLKEYDYTDNTYVTSTDATQSLALLDGNGTAVETGTHTTTGTYTFSDHRPGEYSIGLDNGWDWYWPVSPITIAWPTRLTIRYNDSIVFDDSFSLDTTATVTYHDNATSTISTSTINDHSVFHALHIADEMSDAFSLSDISYYDSFASYLVNCLTLPLPTSTEACANWQYLVNGNYPTEGMDAYTLEEGEVNHIYLYFGERYNVKTDKKRYALGTAVTGTLQEYDYTQNTYGDLSRTDHTIALLNNAGTAITSTPLSATGKATFNPSTTGTFHMGLDNGWNWYWPVTTFTVTTTQENTTDIDPSSNAGSSGNTASESDTVAAAEKMIAYLDSRQKENGAIENAYYSDWAAIAYGAYDDESAAGYSALSSYLKTNPAISRSHCPITDTARRAMALMSLNISPYDGSETNYIDLLITQYNDASIQAKCTINADIFILFPLLDAGYTADDSIIQVAVDTILAEQKQNNGLFGSPDLTAAAIQALATIDSMDGVSAAIEQARQGLKDAQNDDAGFGNIYATSWALQSIAAVDDTPDDWEKNNTTPHKALLEVQDSETGAITADDPLRATTYAIPAVLGATWGDILSSFNKPAPSPTDVPSQQPSNDDATTAQDIDTAAADLFFKRLFSQAVRTSSIHTTTRSQKTAITTTGTDALAEDTPHDVRKAVRAALAAGQTIRTTVQSSINVYEAVNDDNEIQTLTEFIFTFPTEDINTTTTVMIVIPKTIAASANTIAGTFNILADDPIITFTLSPNADTTITYAVAGDHSSSDAQTLVYLTTEPEQEKVHSLDETDIAPPRETNTTTQASNQSPNTDQRSGSVSTPVATAAITESQTPTTAVQNFAATTNTPAEKGTSTTTKEAVDNPATTTTSMQDNNRSPMEKILRWLFGSSAVVTVVAGGFIGLRWLRTLV